MKNERISMTLMEQKAVMLNILTEFADFCEKNGLKYFIDAGTLLGAVRHKGYIPWDDDIDVNMPIEDYDRFIELVENNDRYMKEHLRIEGPDVTIHPFLKIIDDRTILVENSDKYPIEGGVYIDVFPKVGIMDDGLLTKFVCWKSALYGYFQWFNKFSIYAWKENGNIIKKIMAAIGRKIIRHPNFPVYCQQNLIHKYVKKHPLEKCKYVTTLTNGEFINRAKKECFDDYVMLPFENKKFRAPIGYKEYLPCLYGDTYMELPPEDKRRSHNVPCFWISELKKQDALKQLKENGIVIQGISRINAKGGN